MLQVCKETVREVITIRVAMYFLNFLNFRIFWNGKFNTYCWNNNLSSPRAFHIGISLMPIEKIPKI